MSRNLFLMILILIFILQSCFTIYNKTFVNQPSEDYVIDEKILRINGYYYDEDSIISREYDSANHRFTDVKYYQKCMTPIILYSNGYIKVEGMYLSCMGDERSGLKKENTFDNCHKLIQWSLMQSKSKKTINKKGDIWNWGTYSILKDSITLQYFWNMDGEFHLRENRGIVINDSTIRFNKIRDYDRSGQIKERRIDKLYILKKFDYKPDSTNNYIMNNRNEFI